MSFTMSENGEALADITNKVASVQVNEGAIKRVRDAQWVEPQKFDYDVYNTGPRNIGVSIPAASTEADVNAPS